MDNYDVYFKKYKNLKYREILEIATNQTETEKRQLLLDYADLMFESEFGNVADTGAIKSFYSQ